MTLYEAIVFVDQIEDEVAWNKTNAAIGVGAGDLVGEHWRECRVGDQRKERIVFSAGADPQKDDTWILFRGADHYSIEAGELIRRFSSTRPRNVRVPPSSTCDRLQAALIASRKGPQR